MPHSDQLCFGGWEVGDGQMVEDGHTCVRAAQSSRWFKCIRPNHLAQGCVMLCTVQRQPASALAIKSPSPWCLAGKENDVRSSVRFPQGFPSVIELLLSCESSFGPKTLGLRAHRPDPCDVAVACVTKFRPKTQKRWR